MIKKLYLYSLRFLLIGVVIFAQLCMPVSAASKNKTFGDLKNELSTLKAKKAKQENDKKQTQNEINANKNNIIKTHAELERTKEEIAALEKRVEDTNVEIEKTKELTEKILILYQELQSENIYASYITGASSMTELVTRMDAINFLTDYNERKMQELEQLVESNKKMNKEIENYQVKLDQKIIAYENANDKLADDLKELEHGALTIQQQIDVTQDQVNYYKNIGCKDSQTLIECDNLTLNNTGWLRPISKGRITSLYGYRTSPTAGASSNHKGIDIGVAEGTKVYGTAAGKVAGIVRKSSCGGNMVYIQTVVNGKPYTYVFMHLLEIWVNVGDNVTTNTVVGLSGGGSTGTKRGGYDRCTTGAHLHYGLATGYHVSNFNSYTINPPGYPGLYQWFYTR